MILCGCWPTSHWTLPRSSGPCSTLTFSSRLFEKIWRHVLPASNTRKCSQDGLFLRTQQRTRWRLRCCHARSHSLLGSQGRRCPEESSGSFLNSWCNCVCLGVSLSQLQVAILPWNHDYKFFLCRCLPGGYLPLHPQGLPAAWAGLAPPLWRSLMRNTEFSTKCLLCHSCCHLGRLCCVRKMWRFI